MNNQVKDNTKSFDHYRRMIGLIGGPLLAILVFLTPIAGINMAAHKLLAIMVFVSCWWITEPIPIPVTSLIGPTLAVVTGVVNVNDTFSSFANPMIFLFIGGFIMAAAMMKHGLDKRFAYWLLSRRWVGSNPKRILIVIGIAACLCSGWISNTATAAMMLPICVGLLELIKEMFAANGRDIDLNNYKYATGLMLMTVYSCSIGGVLTPIGTPPNTIMLSFLHDMAKVNISFFEWISWGFIAMTLYFVLAYIVISRFFPADVKEIEGAKEYISAKRAELGKWTKAQKNTLFCFMLAVTLWVLPGVLSIALGNDHPITQTYNQLIPESIVSMLGALLLFIIPTNIRKHEVTLNWEEAKEGIEWGTLILFGGCLALGSMMYKVGLSKWFGDAIVGFLGGTPTLFELILIFSLLALFLSELTSHTAATNMIGPLAITTAMTAGINPIPVAVAIALASSLGFVLPVSTPPNAIFYSSGKIPITKMIKTGIFIDIIGILCITIPLVMFFVTWILGI